MKKIQVLLFWLVLLPIFASAQTNNLGPCGLGQNCSVSAVWTASARSSGTNNAQIVATNTGDFTLQAGNAVIFIPGVTSTGALAVNVDGQGVTNVTVNGGTAPAGAFTLGAAVTIVYDGAQFDVVSLSTLSAIGGLAASNNLSDVSSIPASRGNLCPGRTVSSGASDPATIADCEVRWNKTVGSASAQSIPACNSSNNNFSIIITDEKGDANINNITITPVSGTILNNTGYIISTIGGSATFRCDGANTNYTVN